MAEGTWYMVLPFPWQKTVGFLNLSNMQFKKQCAKCDCVKVFTKKSGHSLVSEKMFIEVNGS